MVTKWPKQSFCFVGLITPPVGAAAGCDHFDLAVGNQKIAASFHSTAPTGECGHQTLGAGLLAMAACQPVSMLDMPASSRASPLPQWNCCEHEICARQQTAGAGLLAMAACQPVSMLDASASSRASPLPQWSCCEHEICARQQTAGAGLLAMAACQPVSMLDMPASSRASPLPHGRFPVGRCRWLQRPSVSSSPISF